MRFAVEDLSRRGQTAILVLGFLAMCRRVWGGEIAISLKKVIKEIDEFAQVGVDCDVVGQDFREMPTPSGFAAYLDPEHKCKPGCRQTRGDVPRDGPHDLKTKNAALSYFCDYANAQLRKIAKKKKLKQPGPLWRSANELAIIGLTNPLTWLA